MGFLETIAGRAVGTREGRDFTALAVSLQTVASSLRSRQLNEGCYVMDTEMPFGMSIGFND